MTGDLQQNIVSVIERLLDFQYSNIGKNYVILNLLDAFERSGLIQDYDEFHKLCASVTDANEVRAKKHLSCLWDQSGN